jgi:hypothetical protein
MSSGSAPQESKPQVEAQQASLKYEVRNQFTAYRVQSEGGTGQDPRILETGAIIWADSDFGKDKPAFGALIVRFLCNDAWFYVDLETFARCTRAVPGTTD